MSKAKDADKIATSCVIAAAEPDQLMSFKIMDTHYLVLEQTKAPPHTPKRNRAWRRKNKFLYRGRDCRHTSTFWKPEKRFNLMSGRPFKLKRAMRLGFEYPRISPQQRRLNAQHEYWNSIN